MTGENIDASARDFSAAPGESTSEQVAAYLSRNPDFLTRSDVIGVLAAPGRWGDSGDCVVDMQQAMLNRLRGEIDNLRECAQDLIETSRANMSNQTRTHAAALALMAAYDFEHFIDVLNNDLPLLLDVDAVSIAFEPLENNVPLTDSPYVGRAPERTVDYFLENGRDVAMLSDMDGGETIFPAHSGLIRSAAVARLRPGVKTPAGIMAIGSRANVFQPGQGGELVVFLARMVERCVHRWFEGQA